MLVSGSTMTASSDQAWDYFGEFYQKRFLPAVQGKVVLFVAGDVHENRPPPRNGSNLIEIVSSGSGLTPVWLDKRNYDVIEFGGNAASVYLYKRGKVEYTAQLNLVTGTFATTMSAFLDEAAALSIGVEEATEQRAKAMRALQMMQ